MTLATNFKATAKRMLEKYGDTITVTRRTDGAYSPTTLDVVQTESTYTILGIKSTYKPGELLVNSSILTTDMKLTCYSETTRPIVGDIVLIESQDYHVAAVEITSLTAVDIIYKLQLQL